MVQIRILRKEKNITMKQLGKMIGVSESAVSQYENGKRQPDIDTLIKIADFFNCSMDYLLRRTENRQLHFKINEAVRLTSREETHINKYRKLDEHSKDIVDFITNRELERHVEVSTPSYIAARDGNKPNAKTLTEAELIKIDIQADNE